MKQRMLFAALVLAALIPAADAAAQACIGVPIHAGEFAVEGVYSITDGGKGYGGSATANFAGPLALQAEFRLWDIDDVEEDMTSLGVRGAYELPGMSFSLCPVAGIEYSSWSAEAFGAELDITELMVPIGLGLGRTMAAGEQADVTLYAIPQYLYIRSRAKASFGGDSMSETDTANEFGALLGARLGIGRIHLGVSAGLTTIEESDPVFSFSLGFALGGSR